jgi:hypothetical protein
MPATDVRINPESLQALCTKGLQGHHATHQHHISNSCKLAKKKVKKVKLSCKFLHQGNQVPALEQSATIQPNMLAGIKGLSVSDCGTHSADIS